MKRKVALLLSLMLLVTALLPVSVSAEDDMGLEAAITAVREKLTIPENFKLDYYNSYTENGRKVWNLDWNAKDGAGGSMSVAIDDKGNVIRYYFYMYADYSKRQLPKISRADAKAAAESFIAKMNPDITSQLGFTDTYVPNIMDRTYGFHFYRKVNDIPFYTNFVRVEVDRQTGEVIDYYSNWQDNLVFPEATNAIGLEQAQKAYAEKLGLRLEYRYYMKDEKITPYAVYAPKYSDMFIDALTGEKVDLAYNGYYGAYDTVGALGGGVMFNSAKQESVVVRLAPEEEAAVKETAGLMSKSEVENIARETAVLGLTDEFVLENDNLYSDWNDKSSFTWNLYFQREPADGNDQYRSVSVSLDAKTGEIKGFYVSGPREEDAEAQYDEAASKEAVEAFLKEFTPEKFMLTEYDDSYRNDVIPLSDGELPLEYGFRYIRKVGDAVFPSNSMFVRYDAASGKVISFEMTWFDDVEFPDLRNVMTAEEAHAILFEDIGLELQYQPDNSYEYYLKIMGEPRNATPEVRLVYALAPGKPAAIDANDGVLLDYDGQPFEEIKPVEYTDIAGNLFEDKIKILAENGISLSGTEFRPNENIKQKDFFLLLSKVLNNYWYEPSMPEEEVLEQLYAFLQREGIVRDGDNTPDAAVTREDAVKFIIRALKYDEVADIPGIFTVDFKDAASIKPELTGYVAIAAGLNIVSGDLNGNFNPQKALTRAETAALIYNYLQR